MVCARRCPGDDPVCAGTAVGAGRRRPSRAGADGVVGSAAPCPNRMRKEPLMREKQWKDLTDAQKRGIVFLGALQLALLITALIDIRRRPADAINGSMRLWTAVVFINGIGPIAYFVVGRKRPAPAGVTI